MSSSNVFHHRTYGSRKYCILQHSGNTPYFRAMTTWGHVVGGFQKYRSLEDAEEACRQHSAEREGNTLEFDPSYRLKRGGRREGGRVSK